MRRSRAFGPLFLLFGVFGCSPAGGRSSGPTRPGPPPCAPVSAAHASQAHALIRRYCFGCHSADGDAGDEHDFNQPAVLRAQRRLFSARLRAHSMPPSTSPQPRASERALLADWADCGAELDRHATSIANHD
jgi:uncharacterized membrane protein